MLRSLSPTLPIFFVHMPSSEETSGLTEVDRNEYMNHGALSFTTEQEERGKKTNVQQKQEHQPNSAIISQLITLGKVQFIIGKLFSVFCHSNTYT